MMRWLFMLLGICSFSASFAQDARKADSCAFLLRKADLANDSGNLQAALVLYDSLVHSCKGKELQEATKKRAATYTAMLQAKYHVHDAKELKIKMGIAEKLEFCTYWKELFNTGYSNKQEELNFSLVCN